MRPFEPAASPACRREARALRPRLLIVPGLHDSGPVHWQTWLQGLHHDAVRVMQDDWDRPDLAAWSARIGRTLAAQPPGPWIAAAHSFGCLALAHHLSQQAARESAARLEAVLMVAPADPDKFGVAARLPQQALAVHSHLVASDSDPWMSAARARLWARRWGSGWTLLKGAGHINAEAGFGPLPLAQRWVQAQERRRARERRLCDAGAEAWRVAA